MTEFGFNIHKDLMIDHDRPSPVYEALLEKVPSISLCMSCGSCTGTCVSSYQSGAGFRILIMFLRNGMYDQLEKALAYCQFCGKCMLVCPRGINTRKAILEMKKYFLVKNNDII
jgi:heterodisulfide reductase subunit C